MTTKLTTNTTHKKQTNSQSLPSIKNTTRKRAKDKKPVNSQSLPSIKNTGDYLHVIPDDIDLGEIYKITSIESNKSYIGQTQCYTMSDGKFEKWGSEKRLHRIFIN